MQIKTYNIFVSHAWKYSTGYLKIVDMLNKASLFKWNNHSVPKHDPKYANNNTELERQLTNQIFLTHMVIILAGMYVNHSKWIQKEINIANSFGKPIIGIKPRGNKLTPLAVQNAAKEMVGWSTNSIVRAIRTH